MKQFSGRGNFMIKKFGVVLAVLLLAGCGGGTKFGGGSTSGGSSSSSSGSSSSTTTLSMGNGSGASFQAGTIAVGVTNLAAGGSTSLQVSIVDQTGALYVANPVSVTFSSNCIANGTATISSGSPAVVGATVSTSTGTVTVTYTAKGCAATDVITASAAANSQSLTATGTVTVAAASIGSIQFISASPTRIGLKGTGLAETSTLIFQVVDSTGGPVPGANVTFSLNTTAGGLSISPTTAVSGADGNVQTVVSSGTQHTSVRVTASIASPAVATQSSALTVTTGLPASAAFSIAVGSVGSGLPACPNVEAYGIDGVVAPITVRLADRYNNPAPDGTSISFTTDGGHIDGSCTTPSSTGAADGTCKVNWTSANPRPAPTQSKANGRAVILATAIGEESFTDTNGNGFYDSGEPFSDLGEPFEDDNESGAYDLGEYFLDFNLNGVRDTGSGAFKGITCTGTTPGSTCAQSTLAIGASLKIIMSTSGARICPASTPGVLTPCTQGIAIGANPVGVSQSDPIQFTIMDGNNNPVAAGTKVTVSADSSIGTISSTTSSFTVQCNASDPGVGNSFISFLNTISTLPTGQTSVTGNITIQVVSPGGTISQIFVQVTVN